MTDAVLKVVARRVTMTIRAPAAQRLSVKVPAPIRLTVKPRIRLVMGVPKQGPPGVAGKDGRDGVDGAPGTTPIEQSYPIAVSAGQTVLPISPPPTALNGVALEVNGVSYRSPTRIAVSTVAVTWLGAFPLDPSDDVRVTYF